VKPGSAASPGTRYAWNRVLCVAGHCGKKSRRALGGSRDSKRSAVARAGAQPHRGVAVVLDEAHAGAAEHATARGPERACLVRLPFTGTASTGRVRDRAV
jgi:hypothetical protein